MIKGTALWLSQWTASAFLNGLKELFAVSMSRVYRARCCLLTEVKLLSRPQRSPSPVGLKQKTESEWLFVSVFYGHNPVQKKSPLPINACAPGS